MGLPTQSIFGYGWGDMKVSTYQKKIKCSISKLIELKEKLKFQALAFSGSSGAAIAFPVAAALGIPVIYVRKPKEQSHGNSIEVLRGRSKADIERYLIVDDFVSTGATVQHIYNSILKKCEKNTRSKKLAECVGIFLWSDSKKQSSETIFNLKVPGSKRKMESKLFQIYHASSRR